MHISPGLCQHRIQVSAPLIPGTIPQENRFRKQRTSPPINGVKLFPRAGKLFHSECVDIVTTRVPSVMNI